MKKNYKKKEGTHKSQKSLISRKPILCVFSAFPWQGLFLYVGFWGMMMTMVVWFRYVICLAGDVDVEEGKRRILM